MANTKIVHYNLDNINKIGADINIIIGERSNGKSYQIKHKKAVEKFIKTGKRFILMRRLREEIDGAFIEKYFDDVDVEKLTNGVSNCITMYRKALYFTHYDVETGKKTRHEKIGYAVALSTEQNYAGGSYLDVEDIIFEEFISRTAYLAREPSKLMNFYCTVDRKRKTTKLWLAGNTISRVCPYFTEWGILDILRGQKQGTIKVKEEQSSEDDTVKIAIEYCKSTGASSHTIGAHKDMLNSGAWQTNPQPKLPKSYKKYKCLYRFGFQFQSFKFLCEYLKDTEDYKNHCWFIYPYYKDFSKKIIIISDVIKISKQYQRDIYNLSLKNQKIKNLLSTFKENCIFYSSDLCRYGF